MSKSDVDILVEFEKPVNLLTTAKKILCQSFIIVSIGFLTMAMLSQMKNIKIYIVMWYQKENYNIFCCNFL